MLDVANSQADCATIESVVQSNGSTAQTTATIYMSSMDNFVCVSPGTWANIQQYVNLLRIQAENKCQ